ncbi:hypothetical protein ONS95_005648 [Cadophora gregata]|uniref:uncharacterized protein n=1 Tax=Cadophora gregata TaxID=51156 RepID=UPI0026DA72AC|nr:uncharacterized protein ONS95_005648 [Cadophora gregata]KAK0103636.1 hypothetical protein ONS95_005648 [Cadophora gregata]KAK0107831.1 hypothetical protein ONS96_003620 [Cadophora gregata f. sp. sojae]
MKLPTWVVPVLLQLLSCAGLAAGDKAPLTLGFSLSNPNPAACSTPTQPHLKALSLELDFFVNVADHQFKVPIMPLHLLGKKSWNVYNTVNIEKVKRDEAAAAALEAAEEERMQDADAQRRMQILRGEEPTPLAIEDAPQPSNSNQDGAGARESAPGYGYGRERKRRKKAGENDTDFEMRMAAEDRDQVREIDKQLVLRKPTEAPLVDQRGNISLFPETIPSSSKVAEKNPEAEREAARKKKEYEDQYTMRFSNAAGFKQGLEKPWYALSFEEKEAIIDAASEERREEKALRRTEKREDRKEAKEKARFANNFDTKGKEDYGREIPQKDVWGNEDPRRQERALKRMVDNDPLAMMKAGARQVRQVEKERKALMEERERELKELERAERRKRKERRRERDELDGFSLDGPNHQSEDSERRRKRKRRHHEEDGSEDGESIEFILDTKEKRSSSSRHGDRERESEKDRERRHRHKESRRSSHREEDRHRHRHRSRHHD